MKSTNIRNILLFPFSILIICFSAIVATVSLYNSQGYIDDLLEEIIVHTKSHIFADIENHLKHHEQISRANSIFIQQIHKQHKSEHSQYIDTLLKQQLTQSTTIDGMYFKEPNAPLIGYVKSFETIHPIESRQQTRHESVHFPPADDNTGQPLTNSRHVNNGWSATHNLPQLSAIALQYQHQFALPASKARVEGEIEKDEEIAQQVTLNTIMSLQRLNRSLTENLQVHHGYAFIVNQTDQLVAHSKMPAYAHQPSNHEQFATTIMTHLKQTQNDTFERETYRYRVDSFDIDFIPSFKWTLIILLEETSAHSQATSYSQNALITIICGMLLTMLLSGYLANQISKPIRHLNNRLLSWNECTSANEQNPNHQPKIEEIEQLSESVTGLQNRVATTMQELQKTISENRHFINEIEKLALVAENTDDMVLICDPNTQIEWANDSFFAKYQFQLDDVLYRNVFEVLQPFASHSDEQHLKNIFARLGNNDTISLQQTHNDKSGNTHWIHMDIHKIRDNHDKERHFIFVMQDITDQKRYESELTKWKTLFYAADWGIAFIEGSENQISLVNPAYAKHHGYGLNDLIQRPIQISYPEDAANDVAQYYEAAKQKGSVTFETEHIKKNGKRFPVIQNISVYHDQNGNVGGLIISIQDVSEIKNLQSQLIQSQKMEAMGTLAGGMAHDFNNILASILGNAELANLYLSMMTDQIEHEHMSDLEVRLNAIVKACNRASDLTNKILSYSRMATTDYTQLRLHEVLEESVAMIEPLLPASIAINLITDNNQHFISGNESQLQQVFVNLLANAIYAIQKADRKEGKITLSMESAQSLDNQPVTKLSFSDNGCGIPPESMNHIFDPFYTTKEKGKGTGLGLSVVMGIMQAHKVNITVNSQPAHNTEFVLLFPETTPESLSPEQTNSIAEHQHSPVSQHIMMIDDEASLLDIWQQLLGSKGFRVSVFENPQSALDVIQAQQEKIDLVITDYDMEGMTGEALCEILKRDFPNLPLVMLTGYSEKMNESRAKELGIKYLLKKPVELNTLLTAINHSTSGER